MVSDDCTSWIKIAQHKLIATRWPLRPTYCTSAPQFGTACLIVSIRRSRAHHIDEALSDNGFSDARMADEYDKNYLSFDVS